MLARELAQRQSSVFHGEEYREAEVTALQAVCCGFEFRLLHATWVSLKSARLPFVGVAESVDALGLGLSALGCAGSNPVADTRIKNIHEPDTLGKCRTKTQSFKLNISDGGWRNAAKIGLISTGHVRNVVLVANLKSTILILKKRLTTKSGHGRR